jgi:hypothetical protein
MDGLVSNHQVIRPRFARAAKVLCIALPLLFALASTLLRGVSASVVGGFLPIVILVAGVTWIFYSSISFEIGQSYMIVHNPMRAYLFTYSAITSVQVRYYLRVQVDTRNVLVLAAPESSGVALDMARAGSTAIGPFVARGAQLSVTKALAESGANAAALVVERARRRERDAPAISEAEWRVRGVVATISTLVAFSAAALWHWV